MTREFAVESRLYGVAWLCTSEKIAQILLLLRGGGDADVACRHCEGSLKRKLRQLYRCTALINTGLPPEVQYYHHNDEPDENEARFLNENDITK